MFLAQSPGRRCELLASYHIGYPPVRLPPLSPGSVPWFKQIFRYKLYVAFEASNSSKDVFKYCDSPYDDADNVLPRLYSTIVSTVECFAAQSISDRVSGTHHEEVFIL